MRIPSRRAGGRQGNAEAWPAAVRRGAARPIPPPRYFTLPAVRPPTRRFSMIMKRITTGMIATIETPNT